MKPKFAYLLLLLALLAFLPLSTLAEPASPVVTAKAAVLLDTVTGKIIYAKNAEFAMAPASTTKIMTAILAIENFNLRKTVNIPREATGVEGTSMNLATGEQLTMEDLLYGLMLVSGNDAAIAIANAIAGNEERFARMMTNKARTLGLTNTNFKNPNGLPAVNHYSTARDLAYLTKYAMRNPTFAQIVRTKMKTVPGPKPNEPQVLYNHNKLLWRYPYTIGVKTGYTLTAGGCLVSSAKKNGVTLISVVLKSNAIYDDSIKLFDYGFKLKKVM